MVGWKIKVGKYLSRLTGHCRRYMTFIPIYTTYFLHFKVSWAHKIIQTIPTFSREKISPLVFRACSQSIVIFIYKRARGTGRKPLYREPRYLFPSLTKSLYPLVASAPRVIPLLFPCATAFSRRRCILWNRSDDIYIGAPAAWVIFCVSLGGGCRWCGQCEIDGHLVGLVILLGSLMGLVWWSIRFSLIFRFVSICLILRSEQS